MVGGFLRKLRKKFIGCSNREDSDKYFAKRMGEAAFLLFKIKKKQLVLNLINPLGRVDTSN